MGLKGKRVPVYNIFAGRVSAEEDGHAEEWGSLPTDMAVQTFKFNLIIT
jgi:hypothetical protein